MINNLPGLYQLNRLSKDPKARLPAAPEQRFYRLWIVEDHAQWTSGNDDQPLDLSGTLWFFPKHVQPGIPVQEIEGYTFWFDDHFIQTNPLLEADRRMGPWVLRKPFLLDSQVSFPALVNLCRDHQRYLTDPLYRRHAIAYTTATLLLLHLRELATRQLALAAPRRPDPMLSTFEQLIQQHFREQHQAQFYARALNLTPATLRRRCREAYGQSPTDLIQRRLLEEAQRLLLESDQPVKQIAHKLGFEDESYFVRFFRQRSLMPPRSYRQAFLPRP